MGLKKLKVGIAGFGTVGKKRKLIIDKHPELEIIGICDKSFSTNYENNNVHFFKIIMIYLSYL